MLIICLHTKFHIHSYNYSLFIAVRLKAKSFSQDRYVAVLHCIKYLNNSRISYLSSDNVATTSQVRPSAILLLLTVQEI